MMADGNDFWAEGDGWLTWWLIGIVSAARGGWGMVADWHYEWLAWWTADRHDSESLRGFEDNISTPFLTYPHPSLTYPHRFEHIHTLNSFSRVAFATENDPSIQYTKCKSFDILNQVVNLVGFYSLFSKKYFIDWWLGVILNYTK